MDGIDLNISNGSCWSNVNVALEDEYIPCGNVADGNSYACCHYGDNCLSSNACYHGRFGITYLAGCTTQDFSGPACQNKGDYYNQSWVGLVRCDPDQTSWAGCPEENNVVGSDPPTPNCKCSEDTVLFQDSPMLANIASLPQTLGGTISWFPGHEPTSITTTNTASTTSTQATSTTSISSSSSDSAVGSTATTSTPSNTASPTAGLSAGAKAGIGIGSVFGAALIIALIALAATLWRRKAKKKEMPTSQPPLPIVQVDPVPGQPSGPHPPVFSGFKAELPADEPRSASTLSPSSIPNSPTPPGLSPTSRQYQPYRPGVYGDTRHSNVSQLSTATYGYPESLVSAASEEPPNSAAERAKPAHPDTIYEVPG